MLSKILSKNDCSQCKFCCSFRRQSLWETPLFDDETKIKLSELYPEANFKQVQNQNSNERIWTINIDDCYKTSDPEEEAPCPFLDVDKGCILSSELKPFDCSIWPLRIMKDENKDLKITLTPTCPAINKLSLENVRQLVQQDLKEVIRDYASKHPYIIKDIHDDFPVID